MFICLIIIGALKYSSNSNAVWGQAAMCFLWLLSFSLTVGPVGWCIPAEVSATRLRSQTVVLARNSYYIAQVIANVVEPYLINVTELDLKGRTGFCWAGTAFCSMVWAYFRLPETKGRTFDELDVLFANKVPTRQFKHAQADSFNPDEQVHLD